MRPLTRNIIEHLPPTTDSKSVAQKKQIEGTVQYLGDSNLVKKSDPFSKNTHPVRASWTKMSWVSKEVTAVGAVGAKATGRAGGGRG